MFDMHSIPRILSAAKRHLTPAQVDAMAEAVRQAADHGDHVTSEQFKAGLAELRTHTAGQRADLMWKMLAVAGHRGDAVVLRTAEHVQRSVVSLSSLVR